MPRTRTEWLHWFRVDCDLENHPRLLSLAQQIKTDPERALGRMVRFMCWIARHAPRGVLPAGWEVGVRRLYGQGFPDALRRVGWIEETEEGDKFRRWWELNGHLLRDRERKRRGTSEESPGTFQPVSGPTRAQATSTATSTAEEKLRARPSAVSEQAKAKDSVVALPTNVKGSFFGVSASDIEGWSRLYPAVDVPQQLRAMVGWLDAHPARRKTSRGMKAFVNGWLSREQDRGGNGSVPPAGEPASPHGNETPEEMVARWKKDGSL